MSLGDGIVTTTNLYWTEFKVKDNWTIVLLKSNERLKYVGVNQKGSQHMESYLEKTYPTQTLLKVPEQFYKEALEINHYFKGEIHELSALDLEGTAFQKKVWSAVCNVQYGETATYTDIAKYIRAIDSVRAVATAIGKNPLLLYVPCHRIIGKNGSLSGYRDGVDVKEALLKLENKWPVL